MSINRKEVVATYGTDMLIAQSIPVDGARKLI